MKIYISNVKNTTESEIGRKIERIVASGQRIGFEELKYCPEQEESFPVCPGDLVFLPFPSGNGNEFDKNLLDKSSSCGAEAILLVYDFAEGEDISFYNQAGEIVIPTQIMANKLMSHGMRGTDIHICKIGDSDQDYANVHALQELAAPYILAEEAVCLGKSERAKNEFIHICFGVQDRTGIYSSYVGATMASIQEHTEKTICFHVLHDETLSRKNRRNLARIAIENGDGIEFHMVDMKDVDIENSWLDLYTIGSLYRLLIPDLLPSLHKVIYLDADLMVCKDISELWEMDLQGNAIAAVHDEGFSKGIILPEIVKSREVDEKNYFNSGLIVMDLDKIRSMGRLVNMALDFISENSSTTLPDQDALNMIFNGSTLLLDPSWNVFVKYEMFRSGQLQSKVYHYAGLPFVEFAKIMEYDKHYLQIRTKLPWGGQPVVDDLVYGMWSAYEHVTMLQQLMSAAAGVHKRFIFYGHNVSGMISLCSLLKLKDGDYFIRSDSADNNESHYGLKVYPFEKLLGEERGTYCVFVLPDAGGGRGLQNLDQIGLKRGEDYFVVPYLVTGRQNGYM